MIKVDLVTGIAVLMLAGLCLWVFFQAVLFYQRPSRSAFDLSSRARLCPYCAHVLLDYKERAGRRCPVCDSYLEEEHVSTSDQQ